jgi:hypothetical protein
MNEQPAIHSTSTEPARFCRRCGYELRGLTSPRCPECGRTFDPNDQRTYLRRPLKRWMRQLKRVVIVLAVMLLPPTATWGWFFWGWYEEQKTLTELKFIPDNFRYRPLVSPWLRRHSGSAGFVLDRVMGINLDYRTDVTDISGLAWFTDLRELSLHGTSVTDLSPLDDLTNLRTLSLHASKVTDLSPLARLTNLDMLNVGGTAVTDLSPLARLTSLRQLALFGTKVTDISPLTGLKNLEYLSLDGTDIRDIRPLAMLTKLKGLTMANTPVTDISPLLTLKSLLRLKLPKETLTVAQAEVLQRALPGCQITRE